MDLNSPKNEMFIFKYLEIASKHQKTFESLLLSHSNIFFSKKTFSLDEIQFNNRMLKTLEFMINPLNKKLVFSNLFYYSKFNVIDCQYFANIFVLAVNDFSQGIHSQQFNQQWIDFFLFQLQIFQKSTHLSQGKIIDNSQIIDFKLITNNFIEEQFENQHIRFEVKKMLKKIIEEETQKLI